MRFALLIIISNFIAVTASAQLPDFFREYITVELYADHVEVNGVYQLRNTNNSDQHLNLFYPFPQDSIYGAISNVYAFETNNDSTRNRLIKVGKKGAVLKLEIGSMSEKTLYIGYSQKLLGNKAEYILTTTQMWKKPLENTQIELIVPDGLVIENISYDPVEVQKSNGRTHYFINEYNFMPEKNFVIFFSKND